MEFDEIVVKESPGLCRCCLSEGCYKDMSTEYSWMNENEVYADMLLECFDISISQHNDGPNGPNRLICEVCITRLRDACYFKKQVLESEKKFVDMIGRGEFRPKVLIYQTHMKAEAEEVPVEEAEVEYLEDEMDFGDDEPLKTVLQVESEAEAEAGAGAGGEVTAAPLPARGKRGRPKKAEPKPEKKKVKAEKPKTSKTVAVKGAKRLTPAPIETAAKASLTATKRNRIMKRNAINILENSNVTPFKWHRQNFLCFFCHLPYKDIQILKEHTKKSHNNSNIKSAVMYLKRDEKVKIDVSVLDCNCGSSFDDIDRLIDHIKVGHKVSFVEEYGYGVIPYGIDKDTFRCAICKEQFLYFIKLNEHMNKHFGNYVCERCGKSFLSQDRLRVHSLRHGAGFRCNLCPETFDSTTKKDSHESKVHNKNKALKCLFCPETFPSYDVRKRHHVAAHNMEAPEFKCPDCGKSFRIMSKMKVHVAAVHLKEKKFPCSVCGHKFFSRTHVQKHMVKHFGERVYQCDVCLKSYPRKQTLKDHLRIHENDKRFICSVCSQGFVQKNGLRVHMKVHHSESYDI